MMPQSPVTDGSSDGDPPSHRRRLSLWRARARRLLPYIVGAVMFAVAVWVLHSTLSRFHFEDLKAELAELTARQIGLAILFTFLSFAALVGYEYSALGLVGKRLPLPQLALASFVTQSIAHSTGFAFLIGATLRYNFYATKGLGFGDLAKVQVFFTATFTLGVATLAGGVVLLEPWRLATATGLPAWLWRIGALAGLALVIAYVVWGAFFHRPLRWRSQVLTLPDTGATLTQIFFGVADLLAVAAALHVLMPPELGLGYLEILAIFMASIVVGLMSHVPGSLGVFESAVILLIQPAEEHTLPLIGALLAFRAVYYLLPLVCGVTLLAVSEMHRWRKLLARAADRFRLDLGPGTPQVASGLVFAGGLVLLLAAMLPEKGMSLGSSAVTLSASDVGGGLQIAGGVALLILARGLAHQLAAAWRWVVTFLAAGIAVSLALGEPLVLDLYLVALAGFLIACRDDFNGAGEGQLGRSPAWLLVLVVGLASGFLLLGRV